MPNDLAMIKDAPIITDVWALARSLYHEGRLDEARAQLRAELTSLPKGDIDRALNNQILSGEIEHSAHNYEAGVSIMLAAYPLAHLTDLPMLAAKYHTVLGNLYLDGAKGRAEYFDKALVEYEGARAFAEQAHDPSFVGHLENNIGRVLCELGKTAEAHDHLARARTYFTDQVKLAEIDDTQAQVYLAEGNADAAYELSLEACRVFRRAGETRLLVDATRTLQKAAQDWVSSTTA